MSRRQPSCSAAKKLAVQYQQSVIGELCGHEPERIDAKMPFGAVQTGMYAAE